jgi:hypothetical protein
MAAWLAVAMGGEARAQDEWKPLIPAEFGRELTQPWVPVPNGSSGAPRQGWLNTADGFFTREAHLAYDYVDADGTEAQSVLARFHYPLSRRLWLGVEAPFVQIVEDEETFGDVTVTGQLMLAETRNLSLNAGLGVRVPTGSERTGGDQFAVQPQLNLWTDVGAGVSFRGRVGWTFAESDGSDAFVLNAAIGQTVTPHERTPIGDFTWYLSGNYREPTDGSSFLSITPGVRGHVGGNLFLLVGAEFPFINVEDSFDQRLIVQLVQGF